MKLFGKKIRKTFVCIAMAFVMVTASVMTYHVPVQAETVKTGMITGDGVNFREGPGTSYASLGKYNYGKTGTYLGEGTASNGKLWYNLKIDGVSGWVHSDYVKIITTDTSDASFEAYLTAQGFPEDYKQSLRVLHEQYPDWVFEAQHTGLTWREVIEAESKLGVNLVSGSADTSWKSIADGAYNWETGTWIELDSGGWVAASREIIEYHMDPRNFLDATNVFQFLKQSYNAGSMADAEKASVRTGLVAMTKGTFLEGNCPGTEKLYVDIIMNAAENRGVSPYMLAASIIQEMGTTGDSRSISGTDTTYPNIYNYYNIGAYKDGNMSAITRGLWYASLTGKYGRPWNTREKAIDGGAQYFAEGYINEGQDTLYLKKFNVQGSDKYPKYTHQYMTNVQGAWGEARSMAKAYTEDLRKTSLVFKIPVYKEMPEQPCQKPTGDSDPNYMLTALSVKGYSLTPSFSMYEQTYSLIVPNNVSSVTISATPASSTAKVTGTGTKSLSVGNNTATIKVTAENGTERTYTITIVRSSAATQNVPTLSSSTYKISGSTVTGVQPEVSVAALKKNLSASDSGTITVYTASGSVNSGVVGTGNVIRVSNSAGSKDYTVVIYGDNSGDGVVDVLDMLRIQRYVLKLGTLNGVYATTADNNRDGEIDVLDMLLVQRQVLGLGQIKQ